MSSEGPVCVESRVTGKLHAAAMSFEAFKAAKASQLLDAGSLRIQICRIFASYPGTERSFLIIHIR